MNNRGFKISILFVNLILFLSSFTVNAQAPGPVLYFNDAALCLYSTKGELFSWSIECEYLLKQINETLKEDFDSAERQNRLKTLNLEFRKACQKTRDIAATIAKSRGASAVVSYEPNHGHIYYVDSAYDITREVIDMLNKEYTNKRQISVGDLPQDMLII